MTRRPRPLCLLLPVVACAIGSAQAEEPLQWGLRAGSHYTDNVNRTATDEVSSTGASAGLAVGGEDLTGPLQYALFGDFNYQKLDHASTGKELRGRAAGIGTYEFIPETFQWTLAGLFTQMRADLLQAETVDNREDVTTIATGPSFTSHVHGDYAIQANARYTATDYNKQDLDNSTVGGELVFGRDEPHEGFVGLGGGYFDVTFKDHTNPEALDYNRREAFMRARLRGMRTTLSLDAGYARVATSNDEADGPIVRFDLTRGLGHYLTGTLTYSRDFPITQSSNYHPTTNVAPDESQLTAGPRQTENMGIYFNFRKPRTSFDMGYYHSTEEAKLGLTGQRDTNQARLSMSRWVSARSQLELYGTWSDEDLKDQNVKSDETVFGAQIDMAFGRKMGFYALVEHRDRDSTIPTARYKELAVSLYVRYGRVDPSLAEGGATAPLSQ